MVLQVSSSGAAVAGDYDREVNVRTILEYGDFGLDELISLDGNDGATYPGRLAIKAQRRSGSIGNFRRVGAGCGMNPARQRAAVQLASGKGALCITLIRLKRPRSSCGFRPKRAQHSSGIPHSTHRTRPRRVLNRR